MSSIYISNLLPLSAITNDDFFAIVDSGSLTTYRINFTTLAAWISASVISARSITSISSSYATTSSYAFTSSNASYLIYNGVPNGTASYSITASIANTASYFNLGGLTAKSASNAISASYAITASHALTSISSSHAITASYAFTSSNVTTSSYSLSSSCSNTASYALTFLNVATSITPSYIGNLSINPNNEYFFPSAPSIIQMTSSQVIVFNSSNVAVSLPDAAFTCSKVINGANGWEGNATALNFGDYPNKWFDLWAIYKSSNATSASFLSLAGDNPGHSKNTVTPPSGYDYKALVGSLYYTSGDPFITWTQWFEFGERYRSHWITKASNITTTPSVWSHWLNTYPSDYYLKFRKFGTIGSDTYAIGSEIPNNVVYLERAQEEGYEEFTLYTLKHNTTGSYIIANSGDDTTRRFFNVTGGRGHDWSNSSTKWLAYYTAVQ